MRIKLDQEKYKQIKKPELFGSSGTLKMKKEAMNLKRLCFFWIEVSFLCGTPFRFKSNEHCVVFVFIGSEVTHN